MNKKIVKKIVLVVFVCITSLYFSCDNKNSSDDLQVGSSIIIKDVGYLPQKGLLYCYEETNKKEKLIYIENLINIKKTNYDIKLSPDNADNKYLKYNYRLIVDDTICFELSDFQTIPDTMGRTMGGWAIRQQLVALKCNDSIYNTSAYSLIEFPFDARRIIKKGQYDE